MTIDEMRRQKEQLEKEIKIAEEVERRNNQNTVLEKLSHMSPLEKRTILKYMEHDRTSCSDNNILNGYGSADYGARCRKCHLMEIFNGEWDGRFDFSLEASIREVSLIRKVKYNKKGKYNDF